MNSGGPAGLANRAEQTPDPVAAVVWPWRNPPAGARPAGPVAPARSVVLLQVLVMAAVGGVLYRWLPAGSFAVWILAGAVLVSGLFFPKVFRALELAGKRLGQWVGTALTWLLLAPFFYLCFVPARLLLRLRGKDPLQRRFPGREASYWTLRKPVTEPAQYRRQF